MSRRGLNLVRDVRSRKYLDREVRERERDRDTYKYIIIWIKRERDKNKNFH